MQKDFEIVAELLKKHPKEMESLFNAIVQNNIEKAEKVADEIGLSEHRFAAQGGGLVWVVAGAIGLAIVLFTCGITKQRSPNG